MAYGNQKVTKAQEAVNDHVCTIASKINVTLKRCLLDHFEATLDLFIRSEFTYP